MSKTLHTSGLWAVKETLRDLRDPIFYHTSIVADGTKRVARSSGIGEEESQANARLIVAAPILLERLKEASDLLIGASAWLEASNQEPIGQGLRKWVAEKAEPIIAELQKQAGPC